MPTTTSIEAPVGPMDLTPEETAMQAASPVGPVEQNFTMDDVPNQGGIVGSAKGGGMGEMMLEDYFPKLELSEDEEEAVRQWFERDLKSCKKNVDSFKWEWAKYRAVFLLKYVERYYPDMGVGADYSSGLLCDQVLEGMNRMKKAIFSAYPLFAPDTKQTGSDMDIDYLQRAMWCLHTMLDKELKTMDVIGDAGLFDYLMDGSLIMEADTMYERVPNRMLKTYGNLDDLVMDKEKALTEDHFEKAMADLQSRGIARMLVEDNVITKNGLQIFHVDKLDHLIPDGVYSDSNVRFRARRMYLTASDLHLMAEAGWYDKDAVEDVIESRATLRNLKQMSNDPKSAAGAYEQVRKMTENSDLHYQWESEEQELGVRPGTQPYEDVFAVYRVTCKYGYSTKSDPEGRIPKYCLMDYSPEGKKFLRKVAYPHFKDHPNWFHFKLAYAPKSYYGYGFGQRLLQDDFLESNSISLFMDTAALASFNPFLCKHPEAGGRIPFTSGYGPAKVGYVNDINDFRQLDSPEPSQALIRTLVPIIRSRVESRTGITSLVQGRTESSDPRSPASKTSMLLGQAGVNLEMIIKDFSRTGWEPMARFVWAGMYEMAVCTMDTGGDIRETMGGLVVRDASMLTAESTNRVTLEELGKDLIWKSCASVDYLNPQTRMNRFMQLSNVFLPMIAQIAQINPTVHKKYFIRWMRRAAEELDVTGSTYLIPTEAEMNQLAPEQLQQIMQGMLSNMRANSSQMGGTTQAAQSEQGVQ